MDKLENFISENRELFDDAEPLGGHFSRFEDKLDSRMNNPGVPLIKIPPQDCSKVCTSADCFCLYL